MSGLLVPTLLLLLGLAIIFLEMFLPSAGILGFLAAVVVIASVVSAFRNTDPTTGTLFLVGTSIIVPLLVSRLIHWWPHTPLGRRILNHPRPAAHWIPDRSARQQLVGRCGTAKSKMLPSGAITIDGKTYDALTEGIPVDPGQPVRVISIEGGNVVVRPASQEELYRDALRRTPGSGAEGEKRKPAEVTSMTAGMAEAARSPASAEPPPRPTTQAPAESRPPSPPLDSMSDAVPDPFAD